MKNFQILSQTSTAVTSIYDNRIGNNASSVGGVRSLTVRPCPLEGKPKLRGQISRRLTTRETAVLQLIAEGKGNKEAASELCISVKTVEKHREHLMGKLGIRGTALLTHFAIAAGLIQCNPWLGGPQAKSPRFNFAMR